MPRAKGQRVAYRADPAMRKACLNVRQAFGLAALTDLMGQQPEMRSRVATAMCFANEGRNQDTCLP
ncbi:hypothetical protein PSE10C_48950 [Pseudomonas amygdali pv. eriobotryae]|nr:hypothetical protein PSE10C_48950 [Pseudomonas amygdali pv. eriobotryae]